MTTDDVIFNYRGSTLVRTSAQWLIEVYLITYQKVPVKQRHKCGHLFP